MKQYLLKNKKTIFAKNYIVNVIKMFLKNNCQIINFQNKNYKNQKKKKYSKFSKAKKMDDQFDLGSYAPSVGGANSRSGSMKKMTRKTDKSPQVQEKKAVKKNNDFDQLDDLLNGDIMPKKKDTSLTKKTNNSQVKKMNDTVDSFFDQPSTNLNITSKITDKQNISIGQMDLARTSINFKPEKKFQSNIIEEDYAIPNFSKASRQRSKSPTTNQIKISDDITPSIQTHASMRNMRPPLKRKESQTGLGIDKNSTSNLNLGLSLAEQKKQLSSRYQSNIGLSLDDQTDLKPLKSLNLGRRGSMDNKSEKKFDANLTIFGYQPQKKQANVSHFNLPERNQTSALRIDSPKTKARSQISQVKIGESIMINQKHSQFYNQYQNTSILKPPDSFKTSVKQINEFEKTPTTHHAKLFEPPKLTNMSTIFEQQRKNLYDYQKQVQHLKQTYQKQIHYLQQSLDKQITINQETRQRLINQANKMIEQQRKRSTRVHDEQIKRLKEINEWEKHKMEDSYKYQVQNLKSTINQYQTARNDKVGMQNSIGNDNNRYKKEIEHLSEQLQLQKKLLIDRQHHLTKRQLELQEKQQQFNNKRRKEEDYYREQQKILMEKQNKLKNNILNDKKQFMDEKQKIAIEAANMELDLIKRKQKLQLVIKQAEMEKQAVENQRHQVRILNQQMMNRYKQKMNQLTQDKQRVSNLQADLIRKLRIIELKAKQSNVPLNQTYQNHVAKQNNWVKQRPHSTAGQKQQKINSTMQRFNKIQKLSNQTSSISNKASEKSSITNNLNKTTMQPPTFKLDDYIVSMNKNKSRQNNFI